MSVHERDGRSRARRNILHVGKYYPPVEGGIENHVHSLCTGLQAHHDITALVFNDGRGTVREVVDGVRVERVGTLGRILSTEMAPAFPVRLMKLVGTSDVVHLHTPNPVGEAACLAIPRRARLVVTYHSDVVRQKVLGRLNRLLLHRVLTRADRIIVFTRRYMETSPVIRRYADKCAIIPHGVDLAEMAGTQEIERSAADLRRRFGPKLILFVGRLVYYKGVDVLLKAMALLPDARLLIVGDGPLRGSLEQQARDRGLASRVTFLGRVGQAEKVACYRAADVFTLPATHRSEAFGVVQVEAMACGLPIVCTNIDSGVPFVNQHGATGLVVPPSDAGALAEAIKDLLDHPDTRSRFGRAALQRATETFSREVMVDQVLALYDQVLGSREAPASTRAFAAPAGKDTLT